MNENIVLCGFMGCGKTTVGKALAKKTGMSLVDTDKYIEEKENMTISDIFKVYGEGYFRELEHKACVELADKSNLIIATGGGALTFERNVNALKKSCVIVLLDVPVDVLYKRLEFDTTRPLLQRADKKEAMAELYNKRMPVYKKASDIVIDGDASPICVANRIIKSIKE